MAVLCLGILAGYYLLRSAAPDPDGPNADAPPGTPEVARRYKDNPDDALARLQQRLAQAEQERVWLVERVAALEAVIGKLGAYPDTGSGAPATETNEETESAAPVQTFRTSVEALIATGIPTEQAALIQARLDEYDLKQLYMKDRASREAGSRPPDTTRNCARPGMRTRSCARRSGTMPTTACSMPSGGSTGSRCATSCRTRLLSSTACGPTTGSLNITASGYSPARN